ncbi:hypothetical protein CQ12_05565 [Bradyrhizobium jicamae]|uniref:Transposase DDE domain-containing protein n=1 Tax=Bradyrhizobium jicamae TaxID=280332 RepID=A0A0R3LZW6_9BRAD|nr:hypothetical protein CQ12_05565 [Bradyrhizobium jicamae]
MTVTDRKTARGRDVVNRTETLTGCAIERAYVDKGYRGHDAQNPRRIFISGQKRGVFGVIKRELRRRSAIEPIIGHLKADDHLGRCYLKGRAGDAANSSSQPSATTSAASSQYRNPRRTLAVALLLWKRQVLMTSASSAKTSTKPARIALRAV